MPPIQRLTVDHDEISDQNNEDLNTLLTTLEKLSLVHVSHANMQGEGLSSPPPGDKSDVLASLLGSAHVVHHFIQPAVSTSSRGKYLSVNAPICSPARCSRCVHAGSEASSKLQNYICLLGSNTLHLHRQCVGVFSVISEVIWSHSLLDSAELGSKSC